MCISGVGQFQMWSGGSHIIAVPLCHQWSMLQMVMSSMWGTQKSPQVGAQMS